MTVRQVFTAYEKSLETAQHGLFKFCPHCATSLSTEQRGGLPRPCCSNCGFVHYRNPLPGVVVVVPQEGKVLIGQRSGSYGNGQWGLPQGFMEYDEDFLTAAVREVKEETGLQVCITALLNVVTNYLTPTLHALVIVLLAEIISGEPHAGDDLGQLRWLGPDDPLPDLAFAADEMTIRRFRQTGGSEGIEVDGRFNQGAGFLKAGTLD